MPELPEVETIKRKLKKELINQVIKDVKIYWPNIIVNPSISLFEKEIKNEKILDIKRRGKWLLMELINNYLIVHLRMEGKFFIKDKGEERDKHEHIIFNLEEKQLRYHDMRKFGQMHLIKKEELLNYPPLKKLGIEALSKDLTFKYLKDKLKRFKKPIKTTLLDQTIISGIGNIYANEILYLSLINPNKPSNLLTNKELEQIIINTKIVLEKAIKYEGTTVKSYTSLDGEKGGFQSFLLVHNQEGKKCSRCQTLIKKIKIGGRGTYYCPKCQG
ncbi:MAG: DNA-formamidopyrimidine glycosylase [Bacilli bacterium]|jgi:formamidopyrimidine-DNA glycosylase